MKTLSSPMIYYILLLALLHSLITTTNATVLEDFCKKSSNYNSCMTLLQSDPKASSASSLLDLGNAIIQLATKSASDTRSLIDGLAKNRGLPPATLKALATCDFRYGEALGHLKTAADDVGGRNFNDASFQCLRGRDGVDACSLAMSSNPIDQVSKQNHVVYHVCILGSDAMLDLDKSPPVVVGMHA